MRSHQFKTPEEACKLLREVGKKSRYAVVSDGSFMLIPCEVERLDRTVGGRWVLYVGNERYYSEDIKNVKYVNNRFRFKLENGLDMVIKVIDTKPVDIGQMM